MNEETFAATTTYRFELQADAPSVRLWLNGKELYCDDKSHGNRRWYTLRSHECLLRPSGNVLAASLVRERDAPGAAALLFQCRLDAVGQPVCARPGPMVEKPVTHRATVCDLCASRSGGEPECVRACPHDAAVRVDARAALASC